LRHGVRVVKIKQSLGEGHKIFYRGHFQVSKTISLTDDRAENIILWPTWQDNMKYDILGAVRLLGPDQDSQWIWVQIHLANRMT